MSDLGIILHYKLKMKIREMKGMIKNLFMGFMIVGVISLFIIFQFGKIVITNQELISLYKNQIFLGISMFLVIITLFYKRVPLEWHPASMIYLLGSKFQKIFKLSLIKKTISHIILSIFISLILNNFKIGFETIQIFLSIWSLFTISIISRYFIYNEGLSIKAVTFISISVSLLNLQLYLNNYLVIVIMLVIIYITIIGIKKILNTDFSFDKTFEEMAFINRANSIAIGNSVEDAQKFVRETSAKKSRSSIIIKNLNIKSPLIQKNIITFSRINLTITFYIFGIFITLILLYKFELFEFVKTIKDLGLGIPILTFHQTMFINNVLILIIDQKKLLIVKQKEGLYLPYKKHEIIKSFMVLGVPILLITTLIAGIILQKSLWLILSVTLLYSIILALSLYIYPIYNKQKSNIVEYFIYALIFGVSYLLIGFV